MVRLSPLVIVLKIMVVAALVTGWIILHYQLTVLAQQIAKLETQLATMSNHTTSDRQTQALVSRSTPTLTRLKKYIPSSQSEVLTIINDVEAVGKTARVVVTLPTVTEHPLPDQPLTDIQMTVLAYGEPPQLLQMLHQVERLPYAITIDAWQLTTNVRTDYRDANQKPLTLSELRLEVLVPRLSPTL